jgi:hypothetical protein
MGDSSNMNITRVLAVSRPTFLETRGHQQHPILTQGRGHFQSVVLRGMPKNTRSESERVYASGIKAKIDVRTIVPRSRFARG